MRRNAADDFTFTFAGATFIKQKSVEFLRQHNEEWGRDRARGN